ncbi:MAG: hypothetical protein LBU28_05435 [Spirochaetaceae bacterium]|jgi:hypothetical protein|nr:hypothetical protein [Spirochaetaceae bacterium]
MWHAFEPEEHEWYQWNLNGAAAYLRRDGDEWRTAYRPVLFHEIEDGTGGPEPAPPPEGLPVYVTAGAGRSVALRPYFGDKPSLLKFSGHPHLLPDAEMRIGLALPPMLQLELADSLPLIRFMPFLFPETWYGEDTMSGSLYLSLPQEPREAAALVRGELLLKNGTKAALDIDRLVLDTEILGIYEQEGRLACETVLLEGLPGEDFRISLLPQTPEGALRLTPGKKPGGTLIRRGVDLIKTIAGK